LEDRIYGYFFNLSLKILSWFESFYFPLFFLGFNFKKPFTIRSGFKVGEIFGPFLKIIRPLFWIRGFIVIWKLYGYILSIQDKVLILNLTKVYLPCISLLFIRFHRAF